MAQMVGELFVKVVAINQSPIVEITATSLLGNPIKMLNIIGLGLADEKDVSVKGLEIIKKAERVYLEAYTAVLLVDQSVLVRPFTVTT